MVDRAALAGRDGLARAGLEEINAAAGDDGGRHVHARRFLGAEGVEIPRLQRIGIGGLQVEVVEFDRPRDAGLRTKLDEHALRKLADHETQARVLGGDPRAVVDELLLVEREVLHGETDVVDGGASRPRGRRSLREHDVDARELERLQLAALDFLGAEREPDRLRFLDVREDEVDVTGRDTGRVARRELRDRWTGGDEQ